MTQKMCHKEERMRFKRRKEVLTRAFQKAY